MRCPGPTFRKNFDDGNRKCYSRANPLHRQLCPQPMAEGLLRNAGGRRFDVSSAGVSPGTVRPEAVMVMHEIGIDISGHWSRSVSDFVDQRFDYVITVCDNAREQCPIFPGQTRLLHWSFDDPAAVTGSESELLAVFRRVRDEIAERVRAFVSAQVSGRNAEETRNLRLET